jgi:predicted transcriptional regulator
MLDALVFLDEAIARLSDEIKQRIARLARERDRC